jgi:hypothetical protein
MYRIINQNLQIHNKQSIRNFSLNETQNGGTHEIKFFSYKHAAIILLVIHMITWMKMKYNIDDILITPCDFQFILFVNWYNIVGPTKCSHACEIHQHDTRVHS